MRNLLLTLLSALFCLSLSAEGVAKWDRTLRVDYQFSGNARDRLALPANGDFTVWDLDTAYTVDPAEFQTMGRATPFTGTTLYGRCLMTVHDGKIVWLDREALQ